MEIFAIILLIITTVAFIIGVSTDNDRLSDVMALITLIGNFVAIVCFYVQNIDLDNKGDFGNEYHLELIDQNYIMIDNNETKNIIHVDSIQSYLIRDNE